MKYYGKTVNDFYMDAEVPISAKANIYKCGKKVCENYQDKGITEFDNEKVTAYTYNPKTNLLRIYC